MNLSTAAAVATETAALPHMVNLGGDDRDLCEWVRDNAQRLDELLLETGAVLLRGCQVGRPANTLERLGASLYRRPLDYVYRSTPRTSVGDKVFTATEYPAAEVIPQHCENAYARSWPLKLMFMCVQPAAQGGATPLSRVVEVTEALPGEIVAKFAALGVLYVRNYSESVDLPWQTVFQTTSKSQVEAYCEANGIGFAWGPEDSLQTRQVCQGVARHPRTGRQIWFNQAHLFHVSSLGEEMAESMVDIFGLDGLPRHAFYGDGSPIEADTLVCVRSAFVRLTTHFEWCHGDVLLLDNMAVAHGRQAFAGPRRILVSMGDPHSEGSSA